MRKAKMFHETAAEFQAYYLTDRNHCTALNYKFKLFMWNKLAKMQQTPDNSAFS